ncbi:carbohydrate ABC transporter permease [Paenibacillus sp. MBLB4367]|uniref:carbohydrate ABC transporter permease n=1 Tax=Paenibacillus sp. MBLB4367 TaxID=3384767 RepID=UPI003908161E
MPRVKKNVSERLFDCLLYAIMAFVLFITLYPFWNQIVLSFESGAGAYSTGVVFFPTHFSLESYKLALEYKMMWIGYGNTIIRSLLGVALSVTFTALTAYPLSKRNLPYNGVYTGLILFTMLFGGGLIPHYLLIQKLHLFDSVWALVMPGMISAFHVLLMRNFFRTLPDSLEESARVDGAGYFRIFWRIVIPLSMPVLATIALFEGVGHWNAWFDSMIYISDPNKQVLQVVLRKIIIDNAMTDLNTLKMQMENRTELTGRQLQATMIMFSVIPMLVVYPFIQRFFVKGVMIGAIKG